MGWMHDPNGRHSFGEPEWDGSVKVGHRETGCEDVVSIQLA
jgi:hypothetical protein